MIKLLEWIHNTFNNKNVFNILTAENKRKVIRILKLNTKIYIKPMEYGNLSVIVFFLQK